MACLAIAAAPYLSSCSKPEPAAPTKDFAQRHQCPVKAVETDKEASDRMRLSGCGQSEIYVRKCENRPVSVPEPQTSQLITEQEARHTPRYRPTFNESGCAWTRQSDMVAPRAGTTQPKWLSAP